MKPLLILIRIFVVGICWSIFFLEGIRVILLRNWRFDIFRPSHWHHAWEVWDANWVIEDTKEWAFVLIILTFIPLWLTGWAALSLIQWNRIFSDLFILPLKIFNHFFARPVKIITRTAGSKGIKKKKSYKEIRPRSIRPPINENVYNDSPARPAPQPIPQAPILTAPTVTETKPATFDHSLFQFDNEDDDFDFNIDMFDEKEEEKTAPTPPLPEPYAPPAGRRTNNKNNRNRNNGNNRRNQQQPAASASSAISAAPLAHSGGRTSNSTYEVIRQKGYDIISAITVKNILIDFVAVSDREIVLCLNDKEPGDWLADEERFNDEEPLWFSESSHRISPVRKIDIARNALAEKLTEADIPLEIKAYVIIQIGNIINAEDMFDIWNDMNISVCRIDRGTPKELNLFSKTLDEAENKAGRETLEKIKKIIRSIA